MAARGAERTGDERECAGEGSGGRDWASEGLHAEGGVTRLGNRRLCYLLKLVEHLGEQREFVSRHYTSSE